MGNIQPGATLFTTGDALLEKGGREPQIADCIRERIGRERKSALLTHLVKNRWAAVLSAAFDSHFEDDYRQYVEQKKPGWLQVAAMTDPTLPHPANTIPVLKLLGAAYQDEFAYSTGHYLTCQTRWRAAVRTFIDLVKTNPVLCVGMEECPDVLHGLLREFLSERVTTPSHLILLADDPLVRDWTLLQLARPRVRLVAVRGTVGDVCRAATAAVKKGLTPSIDFPDDSRPELAPLHQFRDLVTVVNECIDPTLKRQETTQLHDLLFAPSITRWDAQAYRRPQRPDVRMPFHHLESDGVWAPLLADGTPSAYRGQTRMFDEGLWTLTDDLTVEVRDEKFAEAGPDGLRLAPYRGRRLMHLPRDPACWPDPAHLDWHRREVFETGRA